MEWNRLLNVERLRDANYVQQKHRPSYSQDIDRILFSRPFRRLANKTQVHPLYDNDHIHHRLIHSLEVATVGRSLGIEIGAWLCDEGRIDSDQVDTLAGLVQAACMAHDIGNPPFGHSGESAIAAWFCEKFDQPSPILGDIALKDRAEFETFEGNAQGFRILTRTEMYQNDGGMRLSFGALGAFSKYPVCAGVKPHIGDERMVDGASYIGLKKYGFFENDTDTFALVAGQLGLVATDVLDADGKVAGHWWRRHPLAFLMEAADDICYNIMDLEDAYLAGDIEFAMASGLLKPLMPKSNRDYPKHGNDDTMARFRAVAIRGAIQACVEAFKQNYDGIMSGRFAHSLLDVCSLAAEFSQIKTIARDRIFKARRKTELEVFGRNVIYRILDGTLPLIEDLRAAGWQPEKLSGYNTQLSRALGFDLQPLNNAYDAVHALTDFVSGMTDRYAVKVADMVGRR